MASSSSLDDEDEPVPTELSTPITDMGTPFTSTVCPTGSVNVNSSSAVVGARTTTSA